MTPSAFVSVACVCERDPDSELAGISASLAEHFPNHELVAAVRANAIGTPTLPNLHVLRLAPPTDDRIRLAAALDRCLGDVIVIADPARDGPESVVEAATLVATGAESVYETHSVSGTVRPWVRETARAAISRAVGAMVVPVEGVRACNREVLSAWLRHSDRDRLVQGFPAITGHPWRGLSSGGTGRPRGPLRWRLAAVMAGSASPLRWAAIAGLAAAVLNLVYTAYVVLINLAQGTVEGWTSLSLQMAGMFFLLSIILALLAEYMYQLVKRGREHQLYRVREEIRSPSMPVQERLNVEDRAGNPLT